MASPPAPSSPQQALQEALALHREGKHEEAMKGYVALLQRNPGNLDALYYIAVLAIQQEQFAEGMKVIGRALDISPKQARLHNLRGQAHLRQNQDDEALRAFSRAIEVDPTFPDAFGNRATLLSEMGRAVEAVADFDRALALRPGNVEDHCNRASALADLGDYPEALAGFNRAIALMPSMAPAYFNRADVYRRLGKLTEALRDYDKMIELYPDHPAAHSNRGAILKSLGRLDDARTAIERALAIDPNFAEAMVNRANVALEQGRLDDAKMDYRRALKAQPESAEAGHGLALALLSAGEWDEGFTHYEARERLPEPAYTPLPHPRWSMDATPDERLLLLCEQGLGDMIQFARFAPMFAERGFDVTLLAPPPMRRLLSSLEGVSVANIDDAPAVNGRPTRWLPLMSAAAALGARPDSVPGKAPYLKAEPERVEHWRSWLGSDGFKVGINWTAGSGRGWFAERRDIPLSAFAPLADIAGVRLISLQKGAGAQRIAGAPFRARIETPDTDPNPERDNFVDTAALMANLDLIVTCDTSVPHLAGALGRPVFTAVSRLPDWRWLPERDDSPWYPTMRMFRQGSGESWDAVLARIAAAVADLAKSR